MENRKRLNRLEQTVTPEGNSVLVVVREGESVLVPDGDRKLTVEEYETLHPERQLIIFRVVRG